MRAGGFNREPEPGHKRIETASFPLILPFPLFPSPQLSLSPLWIKSRDGTLEPIQKRE